MQRKWHAEYFSNTVRAFRFIALYLSISASYQMIYLYSVTNANIYWAGSHSRTRAFPLFPLFILDTHHTAVVLFRFFTFFIFFLLCVFAEDVIIISVKSNSVINSSFAQSFMTFCNTFNVRVSCKSLRIFMTTHYYKLSKCSFHPWKRNRTKRKNTVVKIFLDESIVAFFSKELVLRAFVTKLVFHASIRLPAILTHHMNDSQF